MIRPMCVCVANLRLEIGEGGLETERPRTSDDKRREKQPKNEGAARQKGWGAEAKGGRKGRGEGRASAKRILAMGEEDEGGGGGGRPPSSAASRTGGGREESVEKSTTGGSGRDEKRG